MPFGFEPVTDTTYEHLDTRVDLETSPMPFGCESCADRHENARSDQAPQLVIDAYRQRTLQESRRVSG
jgi:hypothetical protein